MHLHDGQYHLSLDREALLKQQDAAGTELVIMVHGWCHNYLNWQGETGMDLAKALTKSGQFTPIYLNYNSGRHISQNGQLLNELLNKLVACWPSPIKSLNLIGHSMGGLVIRSASRYAEFSDSPWLDRICKVIYLGSPHHGAPLAKAGHLATFLMRKTHYAEPLAFGQYLSDGVKDLRHGNLLDEDWQNVNQDDLVPDQRAPVPLTPHAEHYFLAAAIGEDETNLGSLAFGDLLVRLGSATGSHREQLKSLDIAADQCRILAGMDHFDLLKNPAVQQQIVDWLST
jgi:pimeloyl-ACP methyl ester carboxylesterase